MTVSTTTSKASASANGTQHSFAYGFKIFADADLQVTVRAADGTETLKTLNTHYIVTNAGSSSGGNVLFKFNTGTSSDAHFSSTDQRPQSGETVVIKRELTLTQGTDYVANDPFPAESHEDALDRLTFISQQQQEELDRTIKASVTNTISGAEFALSATDRANKVMAFDGSGDLSVTQELGTFKGNWAASTDYVVRDIVKDSGTNNIFIVNTAHTSSGSLPLTTNTNSAKYDLIVDAASSTTAQTAAASSASAASTSATASANSATASANSATAAASSSTSAASAKSASETARDAAQAAQAAAEAALDSFTDSYLGAKSSDPSADNDGDALTAGDLYLNTSSNTLKFYTGSAWVAISSELVDDTSPQLGGTLDVNGNTIDMNGNELILDVDADTSIHANTDDQIDFRVGGSDKLVLSATLADVNANLDVSGTYTGGGLMTTGGNIVIPDAGNIGSASDTDAISIGADGDVTLTQDLELAHDGATLSFGADSEIFIEHVADSGLTLKHTATADDKPVNLTLATGETDMAANDVIGKISFQAPDEGTGTDAVLVSGALQARAEGDFSSSSNATSLDFMTGSSEAATTKMTLTSAGSLGIGTTAPDALLDLASNGVPLEIDSLNSNAFKMQFKDAGSAVAFFGASANTFFFGNSSAAQLARIDSDGIKFGTDSAAANGLGDYEEGEWQPVHGGNNMVTSGRTKYTKIGRAVFLVIDATSASGSSATQIISGLPFTPDGSFGAVHIAFTTADGIQGGYIGNVNPQINLVQAGTNSNDTLNSGTRIIGTGMYFTA